jgi:prophage regulatory protein
MALPTLITAQDLVKRIPYSLVQIGRLEAKGEFPQRVRLGPQRVAWIEEEVESWLAGRERGSQGLPVWHRWHPDRIARADSAGTSQK